MGRKKSDYICPKCGNQGYRRTNPTAVVHYNHTTGRRRTCYLKRSLQEQDKDHLSTEDPPKEFWGESELYHKLGNMANHFHRIGEHFEKIQMTVYKFRPNPRVSKKCVKHLDLFDKKFLDPVEKLLIPYHDERWSTTWPERFKIQMDSFQYGPRQAGIMNAVPTGEFELKKPSDGNHKQIVELKRKLTAHQVKKNETETVKFAKQLVASHLLEMALHNWMQHTNLVEIVEKNEMK